MLLEVVRGGAVFSWNIVSRDNVTASQDNLAYGILVMGGRFLSLMIP